MMAVMVVMVVVGVAVTAMVMTVVAVPECGSNGFYRSRLMYNRSARRRDIFCCHGVAVPECGSDRFCRSLLRNKRSARRATPFVPRGVGPPRSSAMKPRIGPGSIAPVWSTQGKTKKTVRGYKIELRGRYLGFCKTRADAKSKLYKHNNGAHRAEKAYQPVRRFSYVYPFLRANKWQWVAKIGTNSRAFATELAAATYISEVCAKPLDKLKLGKRSRLSTTSAQNRFSELCQLFAGWIPADIASAVRMRKEYQRFHVECPGLYVFALLAKEHPFRECLCRAWSQTLNADRVSIVGASTPERSLQTKAAKVMHAVFSKAWRRWSLMSSTRREENFWTQHVHRNVQYFWTPLNLARQVGLVTSRGGGRKYEVLPFDEGTHVHKFVELHKVGSVLNLLPLTRTCAEYVEAKRAATSFGIALSIKGADNEYKWPWLLRTHLLVTMRANGVERLTGDDLEFGPAFVRDLVSPDQAGWAETWITGRKGRVSELFQTLSYDSPVEFFSAFTCVLFDSVLTTVPLKWLQKHRAAIGQERTTFAQKHGWEPNPAVLILNIRNRSTGAPAASK